MEPYNPYAAPMADHVVQPWAAGGPMGGVWRDGDNAVCHKNAPWPDRCVKCNAPAEGYRLKRSLTWHPPWVFVTFLAGVLIYVIVALIVRKTATVHVGLCPKHRSRRRTGMLVAWLGIFAAFASCGVGIKMEEAAAMGVGAIACFVFLIVGLVLAQTVRPTKIDDTHAWLKCGRDFVESLPPAPGSYPPPR